MYVTKKKNIKINKYYVYRNRKAIGPEPFPLYLYIMSIKFSKINNLLLKYLASI